jgi:luciferase family oxidoreductase group 1
LEITFVLVSLFLDHLKKGQIDMANIHIPVSVLNLVPIREGQSPKQAIDAMVELAQATDKMGYKRFWIAEHHNSSTLVSSATPILIKHTLEQTEKIRVGSGGIMLPNHSPLVVAEQFGTMATMYPERVDLGLGRAPGTDMMTANALRRSANESVYTFPEDVKSILTYFGPEKIQSYVKAFPGVGTNIPVYILGSSTDSAYLAAKLGLPYAFAAHFAPQQMEKAISIYRQRFEPSAYLNKPYMMICLNVIAGESDEEADLLASSMYRFFLNYVRRSGPNMPLRPPVENIDDYWNPMERDMITNGRLSFIGGKKSIRHQLTSFQEKYDVDEIIANSHIYDLDKQKRSYEILKEIVDDK